MLVDLRPHLRPGEHVIRIRANRTLYYDRLWVAEVVDVAPIEGPTSSRLTAASMPMTGATFRWLGYPRRSLPGGTLPDIFDYHDPLPQADWGTHAGLLTRYGDVRALLAAPDNHLVVMGHGEEIALEFDGHQQAPPPDGWQRTYFFYANGFEKGYEITSAHADTVGPLPFQGMPAFPFAAGGSSARRALPRVPVRVEHAPPVPAGARRRRSRPQRRPAGTAGPTVGDGTLRERARIPLTVRPGGGDPDAPRARGRPACGRARQTHRRWWCVRGTA